MHTKHCRGNILIVALVAIVIVSGLVVLATNMTNNAAHFTDRSRDFVAAQAAAEGAVDHAFAIWKSRINNLGTVIDSDSANANLAAPTFTGFTYASASQGGPLTIVALDEYGAPAPVNGTNAAGNPIKNPTVVAVDLPNNPGWHGNTYGYAARAKVVQTSAAGAVVSNGPSVGIQRKFLYSAVPLFQSMYFYETDLEFWNPATMIIAGLVHTNHDLYASYGAGSNLTFQNDVSYVGSYKDNVAPPGVTPVPPPSTLIPPTYPNGQANQLHQVTRFEPLGSDPASVLSTTDLNPNNDSFHELIEPPDLSNPAYPDPPQISQRRLYNKAGIRININGAAKTITAQNGTTLTAAQITAIQAAIGATTTIYDQREGKNVDVTNLDIAALRTAMGATGFSGFNNVIYINDSTPMVSGNMEPKTIRLTNGGILPNAGITIASENAVYIQGDYNTGSIASTVNNVPANVGNASNTASPTVPNYDRKPAAVIADAVMLLSNAWKDTNSSLALASRTAGNTTYNTAIVSGIMPSAYQPPSGSQYGYSGGGNNFPRFLENWSGFLHGHLDGLANLAAQRKDRSQPRHR